MSGTVYVCNGVKKCIIHQTLLNRLVASQSDAEREIVQARNDPHFIKVGEVGMLNQHQYLI